MSKYDGEQILVVPRSLFDNLGSFQGLTTDTERYIPSLLDPSNNFFMDREAAEEDPGHKQIIPYSLFRHRDRYLHYVRGKSGGESRVHLGVVHLFELTDDIASAREDALCDLQFQTITDLKGPLYESLESWSRFCVDALDNF